MTQMKRSFLSIYILFLGLSGFAQHAVQLVISSLPINTVPDSGVFIAGSFNGWNPHDEHYRLQKDASGRLMLGTKLDDGSYEYKITRGSWDRVECKKGGGDIPNRSLKLGSDTIISIAVDEWSDRVEKKPRMSTASKNVMILDTAFLMPQPIEPGGCGSICREGYARLEEKIPRVVHAGWAECF